MAKAFDSVRMTPLRHVLKCIHLPDNFINFIVNIFEHRRIKIITALGLTEEFTAGDGINQGKVIFPLLWRIFYDLLLTKVAQRMDLGYTINTHWPLDLASHTF
jgi:hypothetical protein